MIEYLLLYYLIIDLLHHIYIINIFRLFIIYDMRIVEYYIEKQKAYYKIKLNSIQFFKTIEYDIHKLIHI